MAESHQQAASATTAAAAAEQHAHHGSQGFWDELMDAHNEVVDAVLGENFKLETFVSDAWNGPGVLGGVRQFIDAIEFAESPTFFYSLLAFHLFLWTVGLLWATRSSERTIGFLALLLAMTIAASSLNDYGSAHFKDVFGLSVNYFDANGMFIGAMYAAPLILLAFILQIKLIFSAAKMMIVVQRARLREQTKDQQKSPSSSAPAAVEGKKDK